MTLRYDSQGKQKWTNIQGGGVYATSSGGSVTGFGAGNLPTEEKSNPYANFEGEILIDDPNKPDDVLSDVKRATINARFNNTIRSRVNHRDTPIIVIQQRLHEEDLSGFLLDGGSGEDWYHLNLPVLSAENIPLCPEKHTFEEIMQIKEANRYTFSGQYMQRPTPEDGDIWKKHWFNFIKKPQLPPIRDWQMIIDGAYTKQSRNDPSGFLIYGTHNNNLYILSSVDKHLEMPELLKFIPRFITANRVNIAMIRIEPKASGITTDQLIKNETRYNSCQIRSKFSRAGKEERAKMAAPFIEGGRVFLVEGSWNNAYLEQISSFPNGRHDEHIDTTAYAIEQGLILSNRARAY